MPADEAKIKTPCVVRGVSFWRMMMTPRSGAGFRFGYDDDPEPSARGLLLLLMVQQATARCFFIGAGGQFFAGLGGLVLLALKNGQRYYFSC